MLREELRLGLKMAMRERNARATSTLRLILASIKDRDIAARERGQMDGISNDEIMALLQKMVSQREDSIQVYEQGGRCELAQQEAEEIKVIRRFLPRPMEANEVEQAVSDVIAETGATSLKDMGRVMAVLRERYAGAMNFTEASAFAKGHFI